MKFTLFLPPVIALVVAIGWLGAQQQLLSGLKIQGMKLQGEIDAGKQAQVAESTKPTSAEPLNWQKLAAAALRANQTGVGSQKLVEHFKLLSNEEIIQALEHTAEMDGGRGSLLKSLLIDAWLAKDPEVALSYFIPTVQPDDRRAPNQFATGLKNWTERDVAAAARWFDLEYAKGVFASKRLDGGNELRNSMQSALITTLISKDPAEAERRLAELPINSRGSVINDYANSPIAEDAQAAFAKMIRNLLPDSFQSRLLENQAYQLAGKGDLSQVSGYLDLIEASSDERTACVNNAVIGWMLAQSRGSNITATEVDTMREWMVTEVTDSTDVATGRVLAATSYRNFGEMADLALKYNESSANDEVLVSFLNGLDPQQRESKALPWAESLTDERLRKLILNKLR